MTVGFFEVRHLVAVFHLADGRVNHRDLAQTLADARATVLAETVVVHAFLLRRDLARRVDRPGGAPRFVHETRQQTGEFGGLEALEDARADALGDEQVALVIDRS